MVHHFAAQRILTLSSHDASDEERVDLAHESLITAGHASAVRIKEGAAREPSAARLGARGDGVAAARTRAKRTARCSAPGGSRSTGRRGPTRTRIPAHYRRSKSPRVSTRWTRQTASVAPCAAAAAFTAPVATRAHLVIGGTRLYEVIRHKQLRQAALQASPLALLYHHLTASLPFPLRSMRLATVIIAAV